MNTTTASAASKKARTTATAKTRSSTRATASTVAAKTKAKAAPKAKVKAAAAETVSTPKTPLIDIKGLLKDLKLPGIDVNSLIEARRKDVEALLAANEQAQRGFEAYTRRQKEMLSEAMAEIKANAKDAMAGKDAVTKGQLLASMVQHALSKALADMKEIAELAAHSQQNVLDTLNKRMRESIGEVTHSLKAKS